MYFKVSNKIPVADKSSSFPVFYETRKEARREMAIFEFFLLITVTKVSRFFWDSSSVVENEIALQSTP